jgi:hypothetical protein
LSAYLLVASKEHRIADDGGSGRCLCANRVKLRVLLAAAAMAGKHKINLDIEGMPAINSTDQ